MAAHRRKREPAWLRASVADTHNQGAATASERMGDRASMLQRDVRRGSLTLIRHHLPYRDLRLRSRQTYRSGEAKGTREMRFLTPCAIVCFLAVAALTQAQTVQSVNLLANHILYEPVSGKIYATIP